MKKFALACLCALLFGSCAFGDDKPLVVGFAQIGAESGWRTAETDSVLSAAKELGVDLKFSDAVPSSLRAWTESSWLPSSRPAGSPS